VALAGAPTNLGSDLHASSNHVLQSAQCAVTSNATQDGTLRFLHDQNSQTIRYANLPFRSQIRHNVFYCHSALHDKPAIAPSISTTALNWFETASSLALPDMTSPNSNIAPCIITHPLSPHNSQITTNASRLSSSTSTTLNSHTHPRDGKTRSCNRTKTFETFVDGERLGVATEQKKMGHTWELARVVRRVLGKLKSVRGNEGRCC
jgi:hypothetical protein